MKASEFMMKINANEIEFKTNFESGTLGRERDFAEAYHKYQSKELLIDFVNWFDLLPGRTKSPIVTSDIIKFLDQKK